MDNKRKTLCVAVIGTGYAGRLHSEAFKKVGGIDIRLKTVVDIDLPKAEAFRAKYGYEIALPDFDEILADEEIDIVDICTPPMVHTEMILKSLTAGKHVICEKPLTGYFGKEGDPVPIGKTVAKATMYQHVLAEMEEIREVLKQSGKILGYAENYVYAAAVQKAAAIIENKKSKIMFMKGEESLKGSISLEAGEWSQIGGGALIRAGCHPLSALLALKRVEAQARNENITVRSVNADMGVTLQCLDEYEHRYLKAKPNDVEDYATVAVTFSDGTKAVAMASDLYMAGTRGYLEVYCNDATMMCKISPGDIMDSYFLDEENLENVSLSEMSPSKLGWNKSWIADDVIRGYLGELQDFAEAITQGRQPFADFELAYETMKVLYAAYQSAEEGRRIDLS